MIHRCDRLLTELPPPSSYDPVVQGLMASTLNEAD